MSIKIEATFHGITKTCDMWINYWPQDCCQMDSRVIEFFQRIHRKGMEVWDKDMAALEAARDKEQIEQGERAELVRLKAKYESAKKPPDATS